LRGFIIRISILLFFVNEGIQGADYLNLTTGYPDNRLIYPVALNARYYYLQTGGVLLPAGTGGVSPIVLENRKGGYYWSATAKLEKTLSQGFAAMIAYTHSEARNLVDGSGDQASSAWNGNANVNGANDPELSYASYITPNKLISAISYRIEYLKYFGTSISLFYEGGSGGRFSYTYASNIVRDGAGSNNLIYIPRDASEINFVNQTVTTTINGVSTNLVWTAQAQSDAFFRYLKQDKYLSSHQGQYAERNGAQYPWSNRVDLQLKQDFFVNVGGKRNTIQLSLDILNFCNLLNKNWGLVPFYNQNQILKMANNTSVVAGGSVNPTFQLNPWNNTMLTKTFSNNLSYTSTYSIQLGIRYIFN